MAAVPSSEKTGEIRSASSGSGQHALTTNTAIVIAGASGDLAKKKVSSRFLDLYRATSIAVRNHARERWERRWDDRSGMTHPVYLTRTRLERHTRGGSEPVYLSLAGSL